MIRLSSQSYPRYRRALQPDLGCADWLPAGLIRRRLAKNMSEDFASVRPT
jgi:hypothetical protein